MRHDLSALVSLSFLTAALSACSSDPATGTGGNGGTSSQTTTSSSTTSSSTSSTTGSSSSSTTTSSSSTTTSSSTGGGTPCQWSPNSNPCGPGSYCNAPGCGAGTCAPIGVTEMQNRAPQCGCDSVTYWNDTIASSHGMAVKSAGACAQGKTCGGFVSLPCPPTTHCNYRLASVGDCGIVDGSGECWAVPQTCATIAIGPQTRACGAPTCTDECTLITQSSLWYPDNTCPQ